MDEMTKTVPIVIPSYEPDERLISLLNDLNAAGLGPVIIVNDGSGTEYDEIFSQAEKLIEGNGDDPDFEIIRPGEEAQISFDFES